jgi:2-polyprenyl-3-methyl-5-hydroxy-6-metoxy-1,4-benzoquinol methylase
LGAGSGLWHLSLLEERPDFRVTAVDISEISLDIAKRMASANSFGGGVAHHLGDALTHSLDELADVGISCLLLEHLECPQRLMEALATNLRPGAYAFVTGALTAAEVDHIYEFKRESELLILAETAGFRVVEMLCAAPSRSPAEHRYLPRTLAMIMQRRHGQHW